jgi:hypothetical protein
MKYKDGDRAPDKGGLEFQGVQGGSHALVVVVMLGGGGYLAKQQGAG